jgi:hypothetical protein
MKKNLKETDSLFQGNVGEHIIPDPIGDLVIVQEIPFFKGMIENTSFPIQSGI